jgi:hemoglobin
MDRRAETCFDDAVDHAGLPDDERLRSTLKAYFRWANQAMAAHPRSPDDVATDLPMPRWSWDGPVSD